MTTFGGPFCIDFSIFFEEAESVILNNTMVFWLDFSLPQGPFLARTLSSLGPRAELLPQANEIRPQAGRSPPAERVDLRSVCG